MNIAIVGTGYVGLVSGACFAEMGNNVFCIDINKEKIDSLNKGIIPIYEPGLEDIVTHNVKEGRLHFNTQLEEIIDNVEIVFSAVGTPPDEDGSADLQYVLNVARTFGKNINKYTILVTKSTVPVGTAKKVKETIQAEIDKRGVNIPFDIASNPEFLKEGDAIADFMKPDRVIIGVDNEKSKELMTKLYKPMMLNNFRVIFMDIPSAEMTKYAANSMLATRISFMNEIANLCELLGADPNMVRKGIGSDNRIGSKFLYPGCGYGGSCFPKDVKALIATGKSNQYQMKILESVEEVNNTQKNILFEKFKAYFNGNISGRKVAIWGLSFKPGTDDMREAPSLVLIKSLINAGCTITAYDPIAMIECKRRIGDIIEYGDNIYDCVKDADAIFHITEWREFRIPDWHRIATLMKTPLILDGRNVFDRQELEDNNFKLINIGHK